MTPSKRAVGQPFRRYEDDRLLRGRGMYLDDVSVPDVLHVAFVRSPVAHARVGSIDVAPVLDVPGVVAAYTHSDLGELDRPLPLLFPHPDLANPHTQRPLAADEVNYVGQLLAMVVATSRYAAEDGAEAILVELDRLPVIANLERAISPDSERAHDGAGSNIAGTIVQVVGDPEAAFRNADVVLEETFVLNRSAAMPMEARGVVASFDERTGELNVWDSTQAPNPMKAGLVQTFGLPEEKVTLRVPDTGGGFGVKGFFFYPEEILVPWAAMQLGRAVKWVEDRTENFIGSHHERKQIHRVALAATQDGTVLAVRDDFLLDAGAFVPYGLELSRITASQIAGPYRIPNIRIEATTVYTNTMVSTPYRGAGRPHACFVVERALDRLALHLGIDRLAVRRKNFIKPEEFPYRRDGLVTVDGYTVILDSGNYEQQLDALLSHLDVPRFRNEQRRARENGQRLGLGIACYVESTGGGPYEGAHVEVQPSTGKVQVKTGIPSQGQSHATVFAQIVADELTIPVEDVVYTGGDTSAFPWGVATYASRTSVLVANAVVSAATKVREKALRLAANMLEVGEEDLELVDGRIVVRGARERGVSLADVATASKPDRYAFDPRAAVVSTFAPARRSAGRDEGPALGLEDEPGLGASGFFSSQNATWASGAHAAVVRIDEDTGELEYVRYVVGHDCGTVINPMVVDGQVMGGVAQGIGGAFFEELAYDENGQLQNASFMDFLIPYATEVPRVEILHQETPSPLNPLGIKGTGEGGVIPVSALTAAAIEDAFDDTITVKELPLSPARLFGLIEGRTRTADGE